MAQPRFLANGLGLAAIASLAESRVSCLKAKSADAAIRLLLSRSVEIISVAMSERSLNELRSADASIDLVGSFYLCAVVRAMPAVDSVFRLSTLEQPFVLGGAAQECLIDLSIDHEIVSEPDAMYRRVLHTDRVGIQFCDGTTQEVAAHSSLLSIPVEPLTRYSQVVAWKRGNDETDNIAREIAGHLRILVLSPQSDSEMISVRPDSSSRRDR